MLRNGIVVKLPRLKDLRGEPDMFKEIIVCHNIVNNFVLGVTFEELLKNKEFYQANYPVYFSYGHPVGFVFQEYEFFKVCGYTRVPEDVIRSSVSDKIEIGHLTTRLMIDQSEYDYHNYSLSKIRE